MYHASLLKEYYEQEEVNDTAVAISKKHSSRALQQTKLQNSKTSKTAMISLLKSETILLKKLLQMLLWHLVLTRPTIQSLWI